MRLSRNAVLHWVATSYVLVVRSIPQLVQILMWYNIALFLPRLGIGSFSVSTNAVITPFAAAVLGLGLNEIAYMAEIVRAGIRDRERPNRRGLVARLHPRADDLAHCAPAGDACDHSADEQRDYRHAKSHIACVGDRGLGPAHASREHILRKLPRHRAIDRGLYLVFHFDNDL